MVIVPIVGALIAIVPQMSDCFFKKQNGSVDPPPPECNPTIVLQEYSHYFKGQRISYDAFINPNATKSGNYKIFHFTYFVPPDTNALGDFFKLRAKAYHQAVAEICREKLAFPINEQLVLRLNDETNRKHQENVIHVGLDEVFRQLYDSVTYDCQNHQFVCKISIGYAVRPEAFIPELASFIKKALKQKPIYTAFKADPLGTPFDLGDLLRSLEQDAEFMAGYNKLIEQFGTQLDILRMSVGASKGNYSIFFDSGDFRLNPVSMIVIALIAETYKDYTDNHPRHRFQIVAQGFADGALVRESGIPYNREGRWDSDGGTIPFANGKGEAIGGRIAPGMKGNQQLAYARGFEGMRLLQTIMEMTHSELLKKVDMAYSGALGVGPGTNPYERRVSFIIKKLN